MRIASRAVSLTLSCRVLVQRGQRRSVELERSVSALEPATRELDSYSGAAARRWGDIFEGYEH